MKVRICHKIKAAESLGTRSCASNCAAIVLSFVFAACAYAADYDIAAYVWPAYQPEPRWAELNLFPKGMGEWQNVLEAEPKWPGHYQPILPMWGCGSDADPEDVARKIDAATNAGINVFIYDWYWYGGRPFLEDALDKGFLGAANNGKMKFFIMWANHNVDWLWDNKVADKKCHPPRWSGEVALDGFREIARRWVAKYFRLPNYYRIDGKPVLMIYELGTFVKGMGGLDAAAEGIAFLRRECEAAGLGGLHLMVCDCGYGVTNENVKRLGVDSATMYQYVHWTPMKEHWEYDSWAAAAQKRFDAAKTELGVKDYFAHASVGWDTNPRYPAESVQTSVTNSTPAAFARALKAAKDWCDANTRPGAPKLITLNSWNEWTEGSYLEPDRRFGTGYLDAVRDVFVAPPQKSLFVGITDNCTTTNHNCIEEYYAAALERCGHVPVIIPKTKDEAALRRILDRLDAVVISGGGPSIRQERCSAPRLNDPSDPEGWRDRFDSAVLRYAAGRRMPLLGVCRGEQVMNVFFGGTMQSAYDTYYGKNGKPSVNHSVYSYFGAATNPPTHTISIVPGTRLARLVGTNGLAVACHHGQAVARIAPGFRVAAVAADGLVEAIESEDLPMIGVQFHPETVVAERPAKGFELERLEALFRRLADY